MISRYPWYHSIHFFENEEGRSQGGANLITRNEKLEPTNLWSVMADSFKIWLQTHGSSYNNKPMIGAQ